MAYERFLCFDELAELETINLGCTYLLDTHQRVCIRRLEYYPNSYAVYTVDEAIEQEISYQLLSQYDLIIPTVSIKTLMLLL